MNGMKSIICCLALALLGSAEAWNYPWEWEAASTVYGETYIPEMPKANGPGIVWSSGDTLPNLSQNRPRTL